MRVETKTTTVYIFTEIEVEHLEELEIWEFILTHLKDTERVEIE